MDLFDHKQALDHHLEQVTLLTEHQKNAIHGLQDQLGDLAKHITNHDLELLLNRYQHTLARSLTSHAEAEGKAMAGSLSTELNQAVQPLHSLHTRVIQELYKNIQEAKGYLPALQGLNREIQVTAKAIEQVDKLLEGFPEDLEGLLTQAQQAAREDLRNVLAEHRKALKELRKEDRGAFTRSLVGWMCVALGLVMMTGFGIETFRETPGYYDVHVWKDFVRTTAILGIFVTFVGGVLVASSWESKES